MRERVSLSDRQLRVAFASREGGEGVDLELVQKAVAGELPLEKLRSIVDRFPDDPALAEAWRLAQVLQAELASPDGARQGPPAGRHWAALALVAASLVAIVGVSSWRLDWPFARPTPVLRGAAQGAIQSLLEPGAELPREQFVLAWRSDLDEPWYEVDVLDSDLRRLDRQSGLSQPTATVPEGALSELPAGAEVLWRVEAVASDGRRHASPTFHQLVR